MKTGDSNAQGTDLTGTPDDPSVTGSEQRRREELTRLRREAQEKNQILQDRNDELVRVKAQLDQVQERLAQLDLPASQEAAGDSDADRMRTEFQAQLALLQAELSQKEWALEEHQARAHALEQQLRREIEILRRRIHDQSSERGRALGGESGDPGGEESIATNGDPCNDEGSILFAGHRRWNTGFGRKRRWRF